MQSLRSRLLNVAVSVTIGRKDLGAPVAEQLIADQGRAPASHSPPSKVAERLRITELVTAHGWPCYEVVAPASRGPAIDLIHLHGGAYIAGLNAQYWRYATRLATEVAARVILPVYPLAPGSTAVRTVPEAADVVAELISTSARPVMLSGDSAGGGLALAAALELRSTARVLPDHLALQAPWLDMSLGHPDLPAQAPLDPVLDVEYLGVAANAYAGDLSFDDPRVSPIRADLRGLPPVTLHVGSRDLGLPDARVFTRLAESAGVPVGLHVAPGQIHGYWVLGLPEGKKLRRDLATAGRALIAGHPP